MNAHKKANIDYSAEINRLKKQTQEIAHLAGLAVLRGNDEAEAIRVLTERAAKTLQVERSSIWLFSKDKKKLICKNQYILSQNAHTPSPDLNASNYKTYFSALLEDKILIANDVFNHHQTQDFTKFYFKKYNIFSMLDILVEDQNDAIGIVCLEHTQQSRFWHEDEIAFARFIANQYLQVFAIQKRKYVEVQLIQKRDEYETQSEEYQQLTEELKQALAELYSSKSKLEEKENQLRTIINSIDDMIWSQNINAKTPHFISPSSKKVLGYEPEEFYKDPELWKKIIHPDDVKMVEETTKNYQPLRYFEMRYRVIMPDGSIKWVSDRTNVTYDKYNKPVRLDGIVLDETSRKMAEDKLALSEKTYKGILDSINDAVYIQDKEGFFLDVNKAAENTEGMPKDKIIGKTPDYLSIERKNDIEQIKKCITMAYNGQPQIIEFYGKVRKGRDYIQEISLSPCFYFGEKATIAIARDITRQKNDEKKIKEQAQKLNAILKAMPDMLFIFDKEGFYQEVFAQNPSLLAIPANEIKGINVKQVFGEDQGELYIQNFKRCLEKKELQIVKYSIKENNANMYFEARIAPLNENQVLAVVRDVTESKLSEMELAHERDLLQLLMDNIPDTIYFKDKKSRFTRINSAQTNVLGVKYPEEAIGKSDFDFFNPEHAKESLKEEKKLLKSGEPIVGKVENVKTNTGWRWMYATKVPLKNKDNKITGLVGISRDITELQEVQDKLMLSEEMYRNLTENAFDGIYLRNIKHFEYVNDRFCKITGYSKEELTHKDFDFKILLSPKTYKFVKQREAKNLMGNIEANIYEGSIICKTGLEKQVEFSTSFLNTNNSTKVMGIMRDITERRSNEKLKNEVILSRKSAEFKQKFLANMSHEIRTPLTGILGMIDLLAKTQIDEKQKDYLQTLKHSGLNLKEIINLILDYSKIEAGKIQLKNRVFLTQDLFDNAEALFKTICSKDIKWKTEISKDVPQWILADKHRLFQVINNLVSNAVKFTEKGEIKLKASLGPHFVQDTLWPEPDYTKILIEITDTGIGIDQSKRSALFLPFSQISQEDTKYFEGTGLGLSICKELTQLMGGQIGVESKPDKGSRFWFTFEAKRAIQPNEEDKDKNMTHMKKRKLKILFAEDQKVNQMVISLMLKELGHDVELANNGKEALDLYKPNYYDLILMDIKMPVMDGISATNLLKEKHEKLPPIIGLSANAFEGDREKYMKKGMDEYLTKPLNEEDFIIMIEKLEIT